MIIDFHAHILPGADHGSDGRETSQKQLQLIAAGGTQTVVATPHFYPHRHSLDVFLHRRSRALALLAECQLPASLRICLGAEVQVCEGLEEMEQLEKLCVDGTGVLLLEMPFSKWSSRLIETVLAIKERGFFPVLAHIDRYPRKDIEELLQKGIPAQLNAEAMSGFWSKRRAMRYLGENAVVAFGSDLHGAQENGYALFMHMQKLLGERARDVFEKTAALLEGAVDWAEKLKTTPVGG